MSEIVAWLKRRNGDIAGARGELGKHPHSFLPAEIDVGIRAFSEEVRNVNPHFVGAHSAFTEVPLEERTAVLERIEADETAADGSWDKSKVVAYRAAYVLTGDMSSVDILLRTMTEPAELIPVGSESDSFPTDGAPAV